MSPARRSRRKRDWPRGLYEPRPGYFIWRSPAGDVHAIGRVALSEALTQAIQANLHVAGSRPTLLERLTGKAKTIADVLAEMPAAVARNTGKTWRTLDKRIVAELGATACGSLTTALCAKLIEGVEKDGKARTAQALRSRLSAICDRAQQLGWMTGNPVTPTKDPKPTTQRQRLTLEQFRAIHTAAAEVSEWLPQAMMLALITGADRSTIAGLQRSQIADGYLTITRGKTGARIAIPLALRMDCMGLSLADVLAWRSGVLSPHLIHHVRPYGNAPTGNPVHPDRISHAFTAARNRAGIDHDDAPTFHEIRSLSKRTYDAQGGVDTKALLGHATERMSEMYADPRGIAAIIVKINVGK